MEERKLEGHREDKPSERTRGAGRKVPVYTGVEVCVCVCMRADGIGCVCARVMETGDKENRRRTEKLK